jgi:hypothetical protein
MAGSELGEDNATMVKWQIQIKKKYHEMDNLH